MKRLAILLLLAAPAYAGTLTLSTTAADDAVIDAERIYVNEQTCKTWGLKAGCGTGAVRAAFCSQDGSDSPTPPCTAPVRKSPPLAALCAPPIKELPSTF